MVRFYCGGLCVQGAGVTGCAMPLVTASARTLTYSLPALSASWGSGKFALKRNPCSTRSICYLLNAQGPWSRI
jgi:hypothetical protein